MPAAMVPEMPAAALRLYGNQALRLPKKKSANGQKCFSYRGAKIWNSLPAESNTASSLNGFKKTVKG